MAATLLDGKALAARLREEITAQAHNLKGHRVSPGHPDASPSRPYPFESERVAEWVAAFWSAGRALAGERACNRDQNAHTAESVGRLQSCTVTLPARENQRACSIFALKLSDSTSAFAQDNRSKASTSTDAISVLTDPKGSGEVSEPGDGTCKVGPRACDPQCTEIKLAASASRGGFLSATLHLPC